MLFLNDKLLIVTTWELPRAESFDLKSLVCIYFVYIMEKSDESKL